MSAIIYLRPAIVATLGIFVIAFQEIFSLAPKIIPQSAHTSFGYFWEFIYPSGFESWPGITILYVLVPWVGVMATGYGFGRLLLLPNERRRRICIWLGVSAILLFVVVESWFILSGPSSPEDPAFIYRLLNQRKYPASQTYLLMTLGPTILTIALVKNARGWLAKVLETFGKVPMFYYLLHILLIHLSALIVTFFREGKIFSEWYANAPYSFVPEEHRWSLALLYLVFFIDVILLYFICRWYANYKFSQPQQKWLKFL